MNTSNQISVFLANSTFWVAHVITVLFKRGDQDDNKCNCARPVTPPCSAAPVYRDQRRERYSLLSEFKATETQTSGQCFIKIFHIGRWYSFSSKNSPCPQYPKEQPLKLRHEQGASDLLALGKFEVFLLISMELLQCKSESLTRICSPV